MAKMLETPTRATTRTLAARGITYAIADYFHAPTMTRRDLFGFADVVALSDGIIAIQACKVGDQRKRQRKILELHAAREWLQQGGRIQIWGWDSYRRKIPGDRRTIRETVTEITLDDFADGQAKNIWARHWAEDPA